jgi:subtilisin family serine protease
MTNTIVVLKDKAFADEFLASAATFNLVPTKVEGLPRHFIFQNTRLKDLPLVSHFSVEIAEEDGDHLKEASQSVSIDTDMSGDGGWAAARTIRRQDPWSAAVQNAQYPRTSSFHTKRTGAGVDIFMIDAGCEYNHPEFGGRVTQYRHELAIYATAERDNTGHGSHCFSLALGRTLGIAREARGHSMKFASSLAGSDVYAISSMGAIIFRYNQMQADDRPAVMFFSWSGFTAAVDAAVTDMIDAGIVCCFPAGNSLINIDATTVRPAESDPDTIVVGGLQLFDTPYYTPATNTGPFGTNYGFNDVDILAPAQWVRGANRISQGGGYRLGNGTSYAAPIVAGIIACMLQGYKRLTTRAQVQAVKAKLLANATTGKLKPLTMVDGTQFELPDRIAYLDPNIEFEIIEGLTPREP